MDEADALAELRTMCAPDSHPVLDDAQLLAALSAARIVDVAGNPPVNTDAAGAWASSTAVLAGTVIKVGARWWRASVTATTGASTPSWPDLDGWPTGSSSVVDGDQTWLDNGAEWAGRWDLRKAAALAWEMKAGAAAGDYDFGTDGQTFDRSQVVNACLRMARRYRSGVTSIATVRC